MKDISANSGQAQRQHLLPVKPPSCSLLEDGRLFWRSPTYAFPGVIDLPNPVTAGDAVAAYVHPWSEPAQSSSRRHSYTGVVQLLLRWFF